MWMVCAAVGLGVGLACAQTPQSQQNESQWKQTPEGRTPEAPPDQMNCTGSASISKGKVVTTSNCPTAQDKPVPSNAAQQFPYPGDAQAAKQATPQQASPQQPGQNAPDAPKNAAQKFPYPGEQPAGSSSSSSGDVKAPPPGGLQDAGSDGSSSSSSSSSGYSSSSSGIPDAGSDEPDDTSVPTKTRASRRTLHADPVKTDSQKFAEDMEVAGFYQNDGNYVGAYMRAKDAVTLSADDPDAHLALAEAARKLGKLDEAEQNYKKCLALDPVPKTRKAAQAALKEMTGGG